MIATQSATPVLDGAHNRRRATLSTVPWTMTISCNVCIEQSTSRSFQFLAGASRRIEDESEVSVAILRVEEGARRKIRRARASRFHQFDDQIFPKRMGDAFDGGEANVLGVVFQA